MIGHDDHIIHVAGHVWMTDRDTHSVRTTNDIQGFTMKAHGTMTYLTLLVAAVLLVACGSNDNPSPSGKKVTISGSVKLMSGTGVPGVTITATGGRTATTDASGAFVLADMAAGTYTVMPTSDTLIFDPIQRSVVAGEQDVRDVIFTASRKPGTALVEMIEIPAGTFMMGADSGMPAAGKMMRPRFQCTITKPFYLGKYEITQKQFSAVMRYNPSEQVGDNLPVANVAMIDIAEFCNALSVQEGYEKAYTISGTTVTLDRTKSGYRLPTEAEWELAARGGTTTHTYLGDMPKDRSSDEGKAFMYRLGWSYQNTPSMNILMSIGLKEPNPYGLYDMYGNANETTADNYQDYATVPQIDRWIILPSSDSLVTRGGGSNSLAVELSSYSRALVLRDRGFWAVGFRIARNK